MREATKSLITADRIRSIYSYDPVTGEFKRIVYSKGRMNNIIVSHDIEVDGEKHELSRFIWLHYYGQWPPLDMIVDHIDRDRTNNSIGNLRLATESQNKMNQRHSSNQFGCRGIEFRARTRPWVARIYNRGSRIYLGSFFTYEEAAEAYKQAATKYHGEFVWEK